MPGQKTVSHSEGPGGIVIKQVGTKFACLLSQHSRTGGRKMTVLSMYMKESVIGKGNCKSGLHVTENSSWRTD